MDSAPEIGFVDTPSLRMCFRSRGDARGPQILFVHGGFATGRWWQPLMAMLPEAYRLLAPDLRGCGLSDKPDSGYSIEDMAADLAGFVDALELRDFDLVAHGAGAAIAVECLLACQIPARSLTLVSPPPIEGVQTPLEAIRLLAQMRADRALLQTALSALMPRCAVDEPALFAELVQDASEMAAQAFTEVTVSLGRWNRFSDARRLTLPALLVWGDADPMVTRESITRTLLAIPGAANLEVLQGVGHCPMLDAPLLFAERLVDFIAEDFSGLASLRSRELT